jgi:hypothetical protein
LGDSISSIECRRSCAAARAGGEAWSTPLSEANPPAKEGVFFAAPYTVDGDNPALERGHVGSWKDFILALKEASTSFVPHVQACVLPNFELHFGCKCAQICLVLISSGTNL